MGTHPNGPSIVLGNNHYANNEQTPLKCLIERDSDLCTQSIHDEYHGDLPFLFKVLSIRKAISIQAHPDKVLGARLFKDFPSVYKDPNHKPEMVLALTPFEALYGFRPLNDIVQHLENYPELAELIGPEITNDFTNTVRADKNTQDDNKRVLKQLFSSMMTSSNDDVIRLLHKMTHRLLQSPSLDVIDRVMLRLAQQYPGGDVGIFSALLLNYVVLTPGQAIFLGANEPHAYLSGDCVECMATSDNVVRAGLTSKFKDITVLVDMLTYRYGSAESQKIAPVPFGSHSLLYDPPIDEFSVLHTKLESNLKEKHPPIQGPSILIVTRGVGQLTCEALKTESNICLQEGYVYFIGAGTPLDIYADDGGLEMYRAYKA